MSEKIEEKTPNPKLKRYIVKFASKTLKNNKLFAKVFGKNFARSRLEKNIKSIYTNEQVSISGCVGYYDSKRKTVTLCSASKDGSLLTKKDIEEDQILQATTLHEAVHAVLTRTRKECKKLGIRSGTGLLERRYDDKSQRIVENGRGLNEGFTDWVCEISRQEMNDDYTEFHNFIRLLEVAVGKEKVLEMGKGGLFTRIPSLLGIDIENFKQLIATSDSLYFIKEELRTANKIADILENHKEETTPENEEKYEKASEQIKKIRCSPEFIEYITNNHINDFSDENILKFLKEYKIEDLRTRKQTSVINFENLALDLYFTKDIEKIFEKDGLIDDEDYETVLKVMKTLNTSFSKTPKEIENMEPKPSILRIKEEFKSFQDKYMKQYAAELAREFKEGNCSLSYLIDRGTYKFDLNHKINTFFYEFSEQLDPDIGDSIYHIVNYISMNFEKPENYKNFEGSTLYKLVSQDKTISSALLFNNGRYIDNYLIESKKVDKESNTVKFDFTLSPGEEGKKEYDSAIQNFLELRQKLLEKNPNTEIYIASRNIIAKDGENTLFYGIYNGQIIPMSVESEMNINITLLPKLMAYNQSLKPDIAKKSEKFSNFINRIKNRLLEITGMQQGDLGVIQETTTIPKETAPNENSKEDTSKLDTFDERIKVPKNSITIPKEIPKGPETQKDEDLEK